MSIRNIIAQDDVPLIKILDYKGTKYRLSGASDANILADALMVTPDKIKNLAKHWTSYTKKKIKEELVKHILMVHNTLDPVLWVWDDPEDTADRKGHWEEEGAYDVTEIVRLATKDSVLFLAMTGAAYEVAGLDEGIAKTAGTLFDQVAGKNSEELPPTK